MRQAVILEVISVPCGDQQLLVILASLRTAFQLSTPSQDAHGIQTSRQHWLKSRLSSGLLLHSSSGSSSNSSYSSFSLMQLLRLLSCCLLTTVAVLLPGCT